ncbi:MAG: rRNA maturation RNase YbeY [Clostridia bacterium]|nr:rRNA maturation RNase YbeY [Clostridia bacterium]
MFELTYLDLEEKKEYFEIIDVVLKECYKEEKLENSKLTIQITLTNPENIRKLNKEYRNIDKETDVLSFPMFEKEEIDLKVKNQDFPYEDILGDMVISIPRVEEQAEEYGHSFKRELSYMVVHSFYHLMGYDHMEEEDKKEMREKEEVILSKLSITRD